MPTKKEVSVARDSFSEEFWKPPWKEYISSIGISTVGSWSNDEVPAEKEDEPCISVGLVKKLPKKIKLPETYKGIFVITCITGKVYLY